MFLVHGGYLIEDGQKQDREWNTNYLDLQFVIHMSDFYDQQQVWFDDQGFQSGATANVQRLGLGFFPPDWTQGGPTYG